MGKGRIKKWVLGKDIKELSKPAPDNLKVRLDPSISKKDESHFGLYHPQLGRVTGYAEGYRDVLTKGKASEFGRSYGFFVYVLGRLINIEDEYFGIDSNLLRHGTFARFRLVVHIDKLDEELQSAREGVRDGPICNTARNLIRGIFNTIRPKIEEKTTSEPPGKRMARKLAGSPASLSRRPIIELARLALAGKAQPRFTSVPRDLEESAHAEFIGNLTKRAEEPDEFVTDVAFGYELHTEDGIALYDTETAVLRINALHPFVGAFSDDFQTRDRSLPLELLAMAEVLLEAQLYHRGLNAVEIDEIMSDRDELLRYLAISSGRRNALMISQALIDARNDSNLLERELVAAFDKLGFDAVHIGGTGKPDGTATAHLSADETGEPRRYAVSLEAKSMQSDGKKVSAKSAAVSAIARQRNNFHCHHAVVMGPDFSNGKESSALAREIKDDREKYKNRPKPDQKTITLIRIDDLAKLVRLAPIKHIGPSRLRDFFIECSSPQDSKKWIDLIAVESPVKEPYQQILEEIWKEQQEEPRVVVSYDVLRHRLRKLHGPMEKTNDELKNLCRGMSALTPASITARDRSVELEVPPQKALEAIRAATDEYPVEDKI